MLHVHCDCERVVIHASVVFVHDVKELKDKQKQIVSTRQQTSFKKSSLARDYTCSFIAILFSLRTVEVGLLSKKVDFYSIF